jgi:hypothetical protein
MTSQFPLMNAVGGQPQQEIGALGNRALPPRRAIDKLLMGQQQQKSMAFPQGIPPNEMGPGMQPPPTASSFMTAVLGNK